MLLNPPQRRKPFYHVQLAGGRNKCVLVIVDTFTKYCVLQPWKTVQTDDAKNAFQMCISLFGAPNHIIIDAGKIFKNSKIPELLDALGISYHYSTPGIHRSIGQVKRYMRTIMNLLRIETSLWKIQLVLKLNCT